MIALDGSNSLVSLLLDLVALLPLIGLLYLGRASHRRRLVLVAGGAVVTTLAWWALRRLADSVRPLPHWNVEGAGYVTLALTADVALTAAGILTIAAWILLLYAALQARRTDWFVAMTVIVVVTLVAPLALTYALLVEFNWVGALSTLLVLGPVAALVCAWFLPAGPARASAVAERPTV